MDDNTLLAAILGALWAVSEVLAFIKPVKANGVFQAIKNGIGAIIGKK